MRRVSIGRLVALANTLTEEDRDIVRAVDRLNLLSGGQIRELFFDSAENGATRARRARRTLNRLTELRLLDRLPERRQGGVGGGSTSWVYALGPAGQRMLAYWAGEGLPRSRGAYEPGALAVAHTLAVSDLYVQLHGADRDSRVELLRFDAEPACWREYVRVDGTTGALKPDAFVQVGAGEFEDFFFVELDMGTERRGQLIRKHHVYRRYFQAGVEQTARGVFPAVLWLVKDERRAQICSRRSSADYPRARGGCSASRSSEMRSRHCALSRPRVTWRVWREQQEKVGDVRRRGAVAAAGGRLLGDAGRATGRCG